MSYEMRVRVLVGISILAVLGTFLLFDNQPQCTCYHKFADDIERLSIPNFANVVSNIAYLVPGLMGLFLVRGTHTDKAKFLDPKEALPFYVVFAGAVLLAFGSGFYHLDPNNLTLVADRLTMTVGFMGVISFIIAERISLKWALRLLPALLAVGLFSVVYWIYTELQSTPRHPTGDLRLYGLVQFLPLLLIPAILLAFRAPYTGVKYIWMALAAYGATKAFENLDEKEWIWDHTQNLVSGHSLKHLVSGLGIYFLVLYIQKRQLVPWGVQERRR